MMIISRLRCVVLLTMVALLSVSSNAADWLGFRGPGGLGSSNEKSLPLSWSDSENVAWKTALPGYGASSPIALGDKLYVTCYSGYGMRGGSESMDDLTLHVVCLGQKDGQVVWDQHVKPKLPESNRVRDHGYAGPTPVCDGENLYVFFGKTGVLKFDLTGKQLWQADVGSKTHGWGCGTSPVLYKDLVIVNASVESRSLVALRKSTGEEVWRASGMNSSWNTPHLVDVDGGKQELVVSVQRKILAFDPATGDELWNCVGIPDYVCPSIVSQNGVVYVIGGRTSRAIAVRAGGRGDVTDTHILWEAKAGSNVASPVIHDGHLYWVSDRNKVAYCVRLEARKNTNDKAETDARKKREAFGQRYALEYATTILIFFDTNQDAHLSRDEARKAAWPYAERVWFHGDRNRDNRVSRQELKDEYLAMYQRVENTGGQNKQPHTFAEQAWHRSDTNRDGRVDRREARNSEWLPAEQIWFRGDLDKDDKLTLSEMNLAFNYIALDKSIRMKAAVEKKHASSARQTDGKTADAKTLFAKAILGRFDKNGNGSISRDEARLAPWPKSETVWFNADANGDNRVTAVELQSQYSSLQVRLKSFGQQQSHDHSSWLMNIVDRNKDGMIDRNETQLTSWPRAGNNWFKGDANGDDRVTYHELVVAMAMNVLDKGARLAEAVKR